MSLEWLDNELEKLTEANLLRTQVGRSSGVGAKIIVDEREYLNFASNDYLGLASDPTLHKSVDESVREFGWGSGASPLIVGRHNIHAQLESELATLLDAEAALLFPSGFAANAGTIPSLVGKRDVIFSDAKNHASIIDGCRLSGASVEIYSHSEFDELSEQMRRSTGDRKLIVSDSLFSMDGDVANVAELVELAEQHDAMLMIDEAHALGVLGNQGGGVCESFGVSCRVPVRVGTLSKAFGSHGGFVAGSKKLISFLANRARSYVFSTAAPVACSAAALNAIARIREEPERRERLLESAKYVRDELIAQGWNIAHRDSVTHIIAVVIGDAADAVEIAHGFREDGLWIPCIRPPSVPYGESLLRISLSSAHSAEMISRLVDSFAKARENQRPTP